MSNTTRPTHGPTPGGSGYGVTVRRMPAGARGGSDGAITDNTPNRKNRAYAESEPLNRLETVVSAGSRSREFDVSATDSSCGSACFQANGKGWKSPLRITFIRSTLTRISQRLAIARLCSILIPADRFDNAREVIS